MKCYTYQDTPDFISSFKEHHGKYDMRYYHYHSTYEIFLMLDGIRYSSFNDGVHMISRGDMLIFKPYVLHYNCNRESDYFKRYVMNFSPKAFSPILDSSETDYLLLKLRTGLIHLEEDKMTQAEALFAEINSSQVTKNSYDRKRLGALLFSFIDMIGSLSQSHTASDNADIVCSDTIADTLNYINRHFMEGITLDDTARHAHMSKSYFCKVFKNETGHTFLQYINDMRAAYAHRLLNETSFSVQKVAERAGFSSVAHFERVFKQAFGASPSTVRKKY